MKRRKLMDRINKLAEYYLEIFKYLRAEKLRELENILSSRARYYLDLHFYFDSFIKSDPLYLIRNNNDIPISISGLEKFNDESKVNTQLNTVLGEQTKKLSLESPYQKLKEFKNIWFQKREHGSKQLFLCFPFLGMRGDNKLIYTPLYRIEIDIDEDIKQGIILFKLKSNTAHLNIYGLRVILGDIIDKYISELPSDIDLEELNEDKLREVLAIIVNIIKHNPNNLNINFDVNSLDLGKIEPLADKEEFEKNNFYFKSNYVVWILNRFDFHLEKALEHLKNLKDNIETENSALEILNDEYFFNKNDKNKDKNDITSDNTSKNIHSYKFSLFLNEDQRKVIESALKNSITVVQGPPGTGKSHTIAYLILELLEENYKVLVTSYKPKALDVIRDKLMKEGFLKNFTFVFWIKGDRETQKELLEKLEYLKTLSGGTRVGNYENKRRELIEVRERLKCLFNEILKKEKVFGFAAEKKFNLERNLERKGLIEKYINFISVQIPKEVIDNIEHCEDDLWLKHKDNFIFKCGQSLNISKEEFVEILTILNQTIGIIEKEPYNLYIWRYNIWQRLFLELINRKDDVDFAKSIDELNKKLVVLREVYYSLQEGYKILVNSILVKITSLTLSDLGDLQGFLQDLQELFLSVDKKIEEHSDLDKEFLSSVLNREISYEFLEELIKSIESLKNEMRITILDKLIGLFKKDRLHSKQKIIKEHSKELFKIFGEPQDVLENFDIRSKKSLAEMKFTIGKFYRVANFLHSIYTLFSKRNNEITEKFYDSYYNGKITENTFEVLDKLYKDLSIFLIIRDLRLFYQNLQNEIKNIVRFFDFCNLLTEFIKFIKTSIENKLDIKVIDFKSDFVSNSLDRLFIFYEIITNLNNIFRNIKPDIQLKFVSILKDSSLFRNFYELSSLSHKIKLSFDDLIEYIICIEILNKKDDIYKTFEDELKKIKSKYKNFIPEELQINKDDILNIIKKYIELVEIEIKEILYLIISNKDDEISRYPLYNKVVGKMIKLLRRTKSRRPISIEKVKEEINFKEITRIFKVWIVNLSDVFKIFPIEQQFLFDYVIIDEASQVTPFYILPLMYLARKIVIVGDDKQLKSPELMFFKEEHSNTILSTINFPQKDEILSEFIIDRESSLLRIFESFQRKIMLKEHFRCLPEIIEWSNQKFYGGKLRIMTHGAKRLGRAFEFKFIEGAKEENGVNRKESEVLISDFIDLLKRDEYKEYSFGILSLFHDQAEYLEYLFARKRSEDDVLDKICRNKKEPVIVSTVDGFQGDERDIIFYSFRYAPNSGQNIFVIERGISGENRINVAFTRARKKMIFYISRKIEDFPGLVGDFLLYAKNPQLEITGEEKFDSDFEKDVYERLKSRGYLLYPQYPSCGYFIDLAILFDDMKMGIECDGWQHYDRYGNLNIDDIERQEILERAGWKILRIPSSVYWKDPESYINDLCKRIEELRYKERKQTVIKLDDQKDKEQIIEEVETEDIEKDVDLGEAKDVDLIGEPFDINVLYSNPKFLLELSKWLKDNNVLSPRDRKFVYDVGRLLTRKYTLTEKQGNYLRKIVERAVKRGFGINSVGKK